MQKTTTKTTRPIYDIATEIRREWRKPYFGAVPYLEAMSTLAVIDDAYGYDSGRSIVTYFLSNAMTWRGDVARRCKAELNALLKAPPVVICETCGDIKGTLENPCCSQCANPEAMY